MSFQTLLHRLRAKQVWLYLEDGHLAYEAPEGVLTDSDLAEIRTHKAPIVDFLARMKKADGAAPAITLGPRPDRLPLSFAQERIWFLDQLDLVGSAYNRPMTLRLSGELDQPALERAMTKLVERQEGLRTRFQAMNGEPHQIIDPPSDFKLEWDDLSALSAPEQEARLAEIEREERSRRANLALGSLFRVRLARLTQTEHLLLLTTHHITADGWSMAILRHELSVLYNAERSGAVANLDPLPIQYADYALWQRRHLVGQVLDRQADYWRSKLAGAPLTLDLPTDYRRPKIESSKGATVPVALSAEVSGRLSALARTRNASSYMLYLAAFQMLLGRWAGREDFLIGSPVAGRSRRETEGLIGMFVNTLVMRADLAGDPTFVDLLDRVRNTALEAYEHQDLSFEALVAELQPERDLARQPIFQVLFAMQNLPAGEFALQDVSVDALDRPQTTATFELSLYVYDTPEGVQGMFEYSTALFSRGSAERMAAQFLALVEAVADTPTKRLSDLSAQIAPIGLTMTVSATFTGEPLVEILDYWGEVVQTPVHVQSTGFGQVLQSLYGEHPPGTRAGDIHIVLVRVEDWARGSSSGPAAFDLDVAGEAVQRFIDRLQAVAADADGHQLVAICPMSPRAAASVAGPGLRALETKMRMALPEMAGVKLLELEDTLQVQEVSEVDDPFLEREAGIPYSQEFFAGLGAAVFRSVAQLSAGPYKVVVVDCDNTLWEGLCGESEPEALTIGRGRREFQKFLRDLSRAGVLICLCSKNNEKDVLEVFARNRDMLMSLDHIAAHRIDWRPKSEMIAELAQTLNLGLDSFVFLDDSEIECEEVRQRLEDVLAIQLPAADRDLRAFCQRLLAFDNVGKTAEDASRTESYRHERERRTARAAAGSHADFVAGLDLSWRLTDVTSATADRAVQMTERTTQFNSTKSFLSKTALAAIDETVEVLSVEDRFGDYGLCGLVSSKVSSSVLEVTRLLLSCRVLGRDLEFSLVESLAQRALSKGADTLAIRYQQTARNTPFISWLAALSRLTNGAKFGEGQLLLPAQPLLDGLRARLAGNADQQQAAPVDPTQSGQAQHGRGRIDLDQGVLRRGFYSAVVSDAFLPRNTLAKFASPGAMVAPQSRDYLPPQTDVERTIAALWTELLRTPTVGLNDNFFDLSGNSLVATRVIAKLRSIFEIDIPLRAIFEAPTVRTLAQRIEEAREAPVSTNMPSGAETGLVVLRDGPGDTVVLIHGMGGGLQEYKALVAALPAANRIVGVHAFADDQYSRQARSIRELADIYADWISSLPDSGPLKVVGWSFGGVLAYEVGAKLQVMGREIHYVALIDSRCPPAASGSAAAAQEAWPAFIQFLDYGLGMNAELALQEDAEPGDCWQIIEEASRQMGAQRLSRLEAERLFQTFARHFDAVVQYRPDPTMIDLLEVRGNDPRFTESDREWAALGRQVKRVDIPADHFGLLQAPMTERLAAALTQGLIG